MPIPGNLLTTAMAVMPHTDAGRALEAALSLDVPFWPQLPNLDYHEDMYVQAAEHFPGILLDMEKRTLAFSHDKFIAELEDTMARYDDPATFDVSPEYSVVYHKFLSLDHSSRPAIRGQLEGPISFGFNVKDQNGRPILFDDTVRAVMFDFMARRINVQLARLKQLNDNAFMFIDEPGLQYIFSALSGYNETQGRPEMEQFFSTVDRPCGVHLCGNPDWDFLLNMNIDVLSMDIYTNAEVFASYAPSIKRFIDRGGTIVWGIVPTGFEAFDSENIDTLIARMDNIWTVLRERGIDTQHLLSRAMLSPATCCLINPDKEKTVEKAFAGVRELSSRLREKYKLP